MALLSPRLSFLPPSLVPQEPFLDSFSSTRQVQHRRNRRLYRTQAATAFRASWELAGVLIFSAFPFAAVKAVANSSVGEMLRRRLEGTKKDAAERSSRFKVLARKAKEASPWYGSGRPKWLGPIYFEYPQHLTGEYPGDYGFDVAGLGKDPVAFQKYFNFEILHARWAMLASLGVIVPELLDLLGIAHFVEPVWWRVGYAKLQGDTLDYLGIPGFHIAGSQGVIIIAICQALLMQELYGFPFLKGAKVAEIFWTAVLDTLMFLLLFKSPIGSALPHHQLQDESQDCVKSVLRQDYFLE